MPNLSPAMEIANRAEQLKTIVLAQQLSAVAILDPRLPILAHLLSVAGIPQDGDTGVSLVPKDGSAPFSVSARQVLTAATALPADIAWEGFISGTMLGAAIRLGDMIKEHGFGDSNSPLMEFARHFRNACAHGDRWHFLGNEPRFPAATRRVTVDISLQGTQATWTTVGTREFIEYLDELHAHFLTVALHQCMKEAIELSNPDDAASVANAFFARVEANGFPHANQEYVIRVAESLSIGLNLWPVIPPPSYGVDGPSAVLPRSADKVFGLNESTQTN